MIDHQLAEKINRRTPEKQPRELTVSLQDAAVQLENHTIWDNANINVEQGEKKISHVHADHQQVAMCKVDDPHDPENDGQTYTDQGVNAADQDAADH